MINLAIWIVSLEPAPLYTSAGFSQTREQSPGRSSLRAAQRSSAASDLPVAIQDQKFAEGNALRPESRHGLGDDVISGRDWAVGSPDTPPPITLTSRLA